MIADAAQKREAVREASFVEVIEEQAADPASFIPMRQEKIAIAPVLVSFVHIRAEGQACGARSSVPVQHVLVERIIRREIEPAAEPPNGRCTLGGCEEKSDVAMRRGRVGASRMKYQRYPHGLEGCTRDFRAQVGCRLRHLLPVHMRERYTGPLEYRTVRQYPALAAAAFRTLPQVAPKSCGIERFHGCGNAVVQILQVALHGGRIRGGGIRRCSWGVSHDPNSSSASSSFSSPVVLRRVA